MQYVQNDSRKQLEQSPIEQRTGQTSDITKSQDPEHEVETFIHAQRKQHLHQETDEQSRYEDIGHVILTRMSYTTWNSRVHESNMKRHHGCPGRAFSKG